MPGPVEVWEAVQFAISLYEAIKPQFARMVESKSDRYLNFDPAFLLRCYAGERPVSLGLTYTEVCDLSSLVPLDDEWDDRFVIISANQRRFQLVSDGGAWQRTSAAALTARLDEGRTRRDETTIRVSKLEVRDGVLHMSVQPAQYYDQARTNLVLDFDRKEPRKFVSLRTLLQAKYDNRLPPLSDRRLANTLGVAVMLFYQSKGRWVPYLVRRVKAMDVFPGGLHCTASGVAQWPKSDETTLTNFATKHMLDEIEEEVGLKAEDLLDLRPVAFCREMARGGKPQLFFAGLTHLDRKALRERRIRAADVVRATTRIPEIERDRWNRSADVVLTPSALNRRMGRWGLTLEGAGSLHYGMDYLVKQAKRGISPT